mmetsp:Transcript_54311/g.129066  ORF Transcript_54311/g.129066 Transcript_54311/m.129066 type:complete len:478 (+) Transcript_54311:1061-2494(+)
MTIPRPSPSWMRLSETVGCESSSTAMFAREFRSTMLFFTVQRECSLKSMPPPGDPVMTLCSKTESECPITSTLLPLFPDIVLFENVPEALFERRTPCALPSRTVLCATVGADVSLPEMPARTLPSMVLCCSVQRAASCSQMPYPWLSRTMLLSNSACTWSLIPTPAHAFWLIVFHENTPPADPSSTSPEPLLLRIAFPLKMGVAWSRTPTPAMRDSETSLPWYIPRERSKITIPDPAVPMERLAVTMGSLSSPARMPLRCIPVMTFPLIAERQRPLTTTAHPDTSCSALSANDVVTSPVATKPSIPAAAALPVNVQRSMRPPARSEQRMNTEEHDRSVQSSRAGVAFSRSTTPQVQSRKVELRMVGAADPWMQSPLTAPANSQWSNITLLWPSTYTSPRAGSFGDVRCSTGVERPTSFTFLNTTPDAAILTRAALAGVSSVQVIVAPGPSLLLSSAPSQQMCTPRSAEGIVSCWCSR